MKKLSIKISFLLSISLLLGILYIITSHKSHALIPTTPVGKQFATFLEVFNSTDPELLKKFIAANIQNSAEQEEDLLGSQDMTGGYDLKRIESSTPTQLAVIMQERDFKNFTKVTIGVDAQSPHQIISLDFDYDDIPSEFKPQRMSQANALKAITEFLDHLSKREKFSGTVLIAQHGKPIFAQSYGFGDKENKIPNRLETKFNLGSMNKMFTAVAIGQLAQQGKLKFTDTVGDVLKDYPNVDIARVTIDQLLTHRGGTGCIFGSEFEVNKEKLIQISDYIALYAHRAPTCPAGGEMVYSNYGYILLGAIIEKLSGQNYFDYIREHIYKPAGMRNSDSYFKTEQIPNMALGYNDAKLSDLKTNYDDLPLRGTSAGGGYSTAEDLLKFANALTEYKLLNQFMTEEVTTGKVKARWWSEGKTDYAYGFFDTTFDDVRCFGHGGGFLGVSTELSICPTSGYTIIVLANVSPMHNLVGRIMKFITERLSTQ